MASGENQVGNVKWLKVVCISAILALGVIQAWSARHSASSEDTITYLDIGDAYWRGDWPNAINGQWSPAYSWILGLIMRVFSPGIYWEFPAVKAINFTIFGLTTACFEFFLRQLRLFYAERRYAFAVTETHWWLLGYALFAWFSLKWMTVSSDTPDMLASAFVLLSVAMLLQIEKRRHPWLCFSIIGFLLSLGYLSKAIIFPLSFFCIAVGFAAILNFRRENFYRALLSTLAAIAVFAATSSPFILALSHFKGRFTYSEVGKLNYVWLVNPGSFIVPDRHWQGGPDGFGSPAHSTRLILEAPAVYEFASPIAGTYPPWFDPSYWFEGIKFKFDVRRQVVVLLKNVQFYLVTFLAAGVFGYFVLISLTGNKLGSFWEMRRNWRLLLPAAVGLAAYAVDTDLELNYFSEQPDTRYIGVFIVLLFAGAFASVRLPRTFEAKALMSGFTIATIVGVGSVLCFSVLLQAKASLAAGPLYAQVAEGLRESGLSTGAPVAHLGIKQYWWARLARIRIIAEVPSVEEYWISNESDRQKVLSKLRETGAEAVVQGPSLNPTFTVPKSVMTSEGWQEIRNTGVYIYKF